MHRSLPALLLLLATSHADAATLRYHGELLDHGAPANGRYDLRLTPYADSNSKAALAAAVVFEDVLVEDGFFLLEPEFAAAVTGEREVWIELGVRDADSTLAFATLEGRQKAVLAPLVGQCWSTTGDSGVNPSINFLGTTDGAPLILRSSGGIGINTSQVRDMLTLRGPDDPLTGPNITLTGNLSDQSESGRIRFVEGTAAANQRGAYIRYDGSANLFAIGAHVASDADPANDTDHILVQRSAATRVGIGKVPGEVLDVEGDIRINGGVKYANVAQHSLLVHSVGFNELRDNDCEHGMDLKKNNNFGAGTCTAYAAITLPDRAVIHALSARFNMGNNTATGDCRVRLWRREFTDASAGSIISELAGAGESGVDFVTESNLNFLVNTDLHALFLQALLSDTECTLSIVRIIYTLPDGFIP